MPDISVLDILLGDQHIGNLTLLDGDRPILSFRDDYVKNPERPTLSQSFKDPYGGIITEFNPTQTRVPAFFSNLLPEGHLREYIAERAGVKSMREFFLLWILGQDLPGNVIIRPADGEEWPPFAEKGLSEKEIDARRDKAMRFSLAGVQLKFSALTSGDKGLTIPTHGKGGSWIVKLPSNSFTGVPENEYSMMKLAYGIGMNVPQVKLIALEDIAGLPEDIGDFSGNAFAIERFDRSLNGERIHIEDFAQVFSLYPDSKYSRGNYRNIAEVIWAETGEEGIVEYIKRLTFNALIGNGDMHMKNWSLIYPDGVNAALAPAYDFLSTIPYLKEDGMALNLMRGGSKKFNELSLDSFVTLAAKASLPETMVINTVKETVSRFHDRWTNAKQDLPIEGRVSKAIDAHLKTLPLATLK